MRSEVLEEMPEAIVEYFCEQVLKQLYLHPVSIHLYNTTIAVPVWPATRRSTGVPGHLPKWKKILSLLAIPGSDSNRINL
ncbi:N-acetyltransferase domain-containing protein [Aphis craccivora]|uniref:N-acetyltransferase domain-containing protein n=1 Tax=Aphis craccivora TaxID=307492 RepID=A0A6G0ZI79_APHCR|nr:N-acetyltransferase domain-containing protein [Aphis craccivora]